MRKRVTWKTNRWMISIICDECELVIGTVEEGYEADELSRQYRDQNWGHECTRCRKARERAYDRYVLNRPLC